MARYKKITVAIWGDAKFRALSPLKPSGQALWLYLLTGRETIKVPGLVPAGAAALAESLRWPVEAFREAFGEAFLQGLAKADWEAPLIWIPNAIKHNLPESPNVIRGWRAEWDEIPECQLKLEAWQSLKAFLEDYREAFGEAFREACRQPSPNQEQEQEQIKKHSSEMDEPSPEPPQEPPSPVVAVLPCVGKRSKEFAITESMCAAWTQAYPGVDVLREVKRAVQWAIDNPKKRKTHSGARSFLGRWLARVQDRNPKLEKTNDHSGSAGSFSAEEWERARQDAERYAATGELEAPNEGDGRGIRCSRPLDPPPDGVPAASRILSTALGALMVPRGLAGDVQNPAIPQPSAEHGRAETAGSRGQP